MSEPVPPSRAFVQRLNFLARDASNESAALQASHEVGLLRAMPRSESAALSVEALAEKLRCVPRGVRSLLEVLAGLGFAKVRDDFTYYLPADVAEQLDSPALTGALSDAHRRWPSLRQLAERVRGSPSAEEDPLSFLRGTLLSPPPSLPPHAAEYYDRGVRNFARTQVLIASGELGLLEALRAGGGDLPKLASGADSAAGLEVLVDALVEMGVATRASPPSFSPLAAEVFDEKSLAYFMRSLPATQVYWEGMGRLPEAVKDGTFLLDLRKPEIAKRVYAENSSRISGIFQSHLRLSQAAAALVKKLRPLAGAEVLDVGTGSGIWGAAFGLAHPETRVTYLDSGHVLDNVKQNLADLKLLDRAKLWEADVNTADFGEKTYDLVLLPQIVPVLQPHELPVLFERSARALKPGGLLLISGYVLTDKRDGPMDALYFSLRRYMSNEGDVLSLPDFTRALAKVGLTSARLYRMPIQELVVAHRGDVAVPPELANLGRTAPPSRV